MPSLLRALPIKDKMYSRMGRVSSEMFISLRDEKHPPKCNRSQPAINKGNLSIPKFSITSQFTKLISNEKQIKEEKKIVSEKIKSPLQESKETSSFKATSRHTMSVILESKTRSPGVGKYSPKKIDSPLKGNIKYQKMNEVIALPKPISKDVCTRILYYNDQ
jgi:hypothetical protein